MHSKPHAQLPSMPGAVIKLLQMFSDPEVSIQEVVDTLKSDPALAGRILKAANSSSVAAKREVSDIRRAATVLGKKTVSTLALSFSLSDNSMQNGGAADLFRAFWTQSMVTGVAASVLAKKYGGIPADEAFLIGLLSRIGRLGAISFAPEDYIELAMVSERDGLSLDAISLPTLQLSCNELTLQYMRAWMLPRPFIAHVEDMQLAAARDRCGHRPAAEHVDDNSQQITASTLLRVSSALGQFVVGENTGIALAAIHELLQPVLADHPEQLDLIVAQVMSEFERHGEMLELDTSRIGTPAELHARAMAHLTEIAIFPEAQVSSDEVDEVCEMVWLQRRVQDLTHQLSLDGLTSVYNRNYFDLRLEKLVAAARMGSSYVAVLFVDANEFKQVNDTYGHDVGDEVIRVIARTLQQGVRNRDVVARYGGDEFVILCEMNSFDGLKAQAERITRITDDLSVPCRGVSLRVSLAIGGAIGRPDGEPDFAERLLRLSDEAMYQAKQSRFNPVTRKLSASGQAVSTPEQLQVAITR